MLQESAERPRYSIVIPIFNEEAVIPLLLHRLEALMRQLDGRTEVIFVDDGSRDSSSIVLAAKAAHDPRYHFVALSRNFGHQLAITAGLDLARGDAVIVMDADLQDPPEVILDLVAEWKKGGEIVYAQRIEREGETWFKRKTADLFYGILRRLTAVDIPRDVGDFRLVDRKVLDVFKQMRERDRFVRGMFGWVGFRQTAVPYVRSARAAGSTKYPLRKMLRLANDGLVGFSDIPLRMALWVGSIVSIAALAYGAYVIGLYFAGSELVTGWASTIVVVSFLLGVNLLMTGIVGLYVGRIHAEVKGRPLYIVARKVGFPAEAEADLPKDEPAAWERRASWH
ncbi:glycosyltransferase family 2 protein [Chthonobacter albigriseus]|uniref:glycosyltransferase family 2 protein n=1 Tax=Chthonobacter albigriseus TaxID=1683161 RepID=UPI0015EFD6F5|nr:glycosyltransferase family 2 protein [Chthonobacter albigriseus]